MLSRRTTAIHKETQTKVVINNEGIPIDNQPKSHINQRDEALSILSKKLGINIKKGDCLFKHEVYEIHNEVGL